MIEAYSYRGPHCPRCEMNIPLHELRTGAIQCPHCFGEYQATAFAAPERNSTAVAEVVAVGPEGANACANHERNAAVTSCQRCGLFICALCDMNVGTGSHCPSCFDRLRAEGTLLPAARRFRDYALMARSAAVFGFLLVFPFGILFGPVAVHYATKGRVQRIAEGRSTAGTTITLVLGALETLASLAIYSTILYRAVWR